MEQALTETYFENSRCIVDNLEDNFSFPKETIKKDQTNLVAQGSHVECRQKLEKPNQKL